MSLGFKGLTADSNIFMFLSIKNHIMVTTRVSLMAILLIIGSVLTVFGQGQIKIAKLKYNGGGDWYANKTALPNLIKFCNQELGTNIAAEEDIVEVLSSDIFLYPFIYMT